VPISFSGEFEVPREPEEVFEFLTDPQRFAPLLPDFQSVTVQDPTHFTVKLSVGVSHIRGTAEMKLQLAEAERPTRARYSGQGSVVAGNASVNASFDLQPNSGGTRVLWKGEAQVVGRIISMAGGLLEPMAKKNLQKMIDSLRAALEGKAQPPTPTAATQAAPPSAAQQPSAATSSESISQGQNHG
jgi:carbon monoxide dehydrogenase subunit G